MPELDSCASSERACRLWAAQHPGGRGPPTGRPAAASGARASRLQSRRLHCLWPPRWTIGTIAIGAGVLWVVDQILLKYYDFQTRKKKRAARAARAKASKADSD